MPGRLALILLLRPDWHATTHTSHRETSLRNLPSLRSVPDRQDLGKGHIYVKIVLVESVHDVFRFSLRERTFVDLLEKAELRRRAKRNADHLAGPTALDFVAQHCERNSTLFNRSG